MANNTEWTNNNSYLYGSTEDRLSGMKNSEVFADSAKEIINFDITELGTIKVSKDYVLHVNNYTEKVLSVIDTDERFVIVIGDTRLNTYQKTDNALIDSHVHGLTLGVNPNSLYSDGLFWLGGTWFSIDLAGTIAGSNFNDVVTLPIEDKKVISVDIYEILEVQAKVDIVKDGDGNVTTYPIPQEVRPVLLQSIPAPVLVSNASGAISLYNTGLTCKRVYTTFKSKPILTDFNAHTVGDIYFVINNFLKDKDGKTMLVGNKPITFTGSTADAAYGSPYFTGMTINIPDGELNWGKLKDFRTEIIDVAIFQNRMVIASKDTIYFSDMFNPTKFENGAETADAFYIKPSVINNNQPNILKMDIGLGIWVTTDRGVYSVGYNIGISPKSSINATKIASDIPATKETVLIGESLYYMDTKGVLRNINAVYTTGALAFVKSIVEKYRVKDDISALTSVIIDREKVLIATSMDKTKFYVYKMLDGNMFRCTTRMFNTTHKLIGVEDKLIDGRNISLPTDKNVSDASVLLHSPYMESKKGGIILNDYSSRVKELVINMSGKNLAIKGVLVDGKRTNILAQSAKDRFSIFKVIGSIVPLDGILVNVETHATNDNVEIKLVSLLTQSAGM